MHSEGHFGAALIIVTPLSYLMILLGNWVLLFFILTTAIFGAMLPDMDMKEPWRHYLSHRKETHTIYFAILASIIFGIYFALPEYYLGIYKIDSTVLIFIIGFISGFLVIMSHLLTDMMTPSGVKLLRPYGKKRSFNLFLAKSKKWNLIFLFTGLILLLSQLYLLVKVVF